VKTHHGSRCHEDSQTGLNELYWIVFDLPFIVRNSNESIIFVKVGSSQDLLDMSYLSHLQEKSSSSGDIE
jgi:hypothetical protein